MPFDIGIFYADKFKLIMYGTMGVCTGIFLIIAIAGGATHLSVGGTSINAAVVSACVFSFIILAICVASNWVPQINQLMVLISIAAYGVIILIITFSCWAMKVENSFNSYRLAISILGFVFGLWCALWGAGGIYYTFKGAGGGGGFQAVQEPGNF